MSNSSLNELDLLLGLPKPVEEMTDKELERFLLKHFPHTRPSGTDLASLLNDPLLKGIDNIKTFGVFCQEDKQIMKEYENYKEKR